MTFPTDCGESRIRVKEKRRMSSIIEEVPSRREDVFALDGHHAAGRDAARSALALEIAAQRDRRRELRESVIRHLSEQRRGVPRWPSGPKSGPTLVDEDEWWAKMLGRRRAA